MLKRVREDEPMALRRGLKEQQHKAMLFRCAEEVIRARKLMREEAVAVAVGDLKAATPLRL